MKRFAHLSGLICLVSLFLLSGCDKDDPKPQNNIIGNWTVQSLAIDIRIGGQTFVAYLMSMGFSEADAQEFADTFNDSFEQGVSGTIEFKTDGTYRAVDESGSVSTGKWELTSDNKTLTIDKGTADETVFTVKTLTASNLNLSASVEDDDMGVDDFVINMEMQLTK